ncbi:WecB/TagA/CpsF family glycosyltransferase [Thalassospira sp. HJ]|uniref:WecB/TagA/CpsF family glycosyltransferase n=1 Tax=Thalassospira sp. HJ TaxID=1616823 RepID=UPI003510C258
MGIVWAARLMGGRVSERVTGIDLMTDLLAQFAQDGTRVSLLGARQEVLDQLQATLPARFPGLIIAGTHHGYEMDDEKLARCVASAEPDALFVALPSPRKERFVDQFAPKTGCRFAMGVGGAFDVLASKVRRAPMIWQRAGLEFLWRILCQPRYMIPRYARGLSGFAKLVLPRVVSFQFKRLRGTIQKVTTLLALCAMLASAAELQAQPATSMTLDPENRQAAISWIETELAKVNEPNDVPQLIDALVNAVLSEDPSSERPVIDWQATENSLEVLLGLFDFGSGTSRFLLETILGGVVLRLLSLHPEPDRLTGIVRSRAANLAERLFERRANRPVMFDGAQSGLAPRSESTASPTIIGFVQPSEIEELWGYPYLTVRLENADSGRLWDDEQYGSPVGVPELEDGSPR